MKDIEPIERRYFTDVIFAVNGIFLPVDKAKQERNDSIASERGEPRVLRKVK